MYSLKVVNYFDLPINILGEAPENGNMQPVTGIFSRLISQMDAEGKLE
jgi:hypothetical protein